MASGHEKADTLAIAVNHVEKIVTKSPDEEGKVDKVIDEFTIREQRKIIHRVDRRLVTMLGAIYCIALIDRTNLSNANIAGMATDLHLIGNRYNILNLVLFPPYILMQLPAVVTIRKFGPQLTISVIVIAWGASMIGFGFVKHWGDMVPLRMVLGILEAGFFPGALYLLSTWYVRYDMHKRYAYFYLIAVMSQGFAGILAYGFTQMKGIQGIAGWRWIFIMEGVLTCFLGIISYFILVPFPEKAYGARYFLSDRELDFIIAHIDKDREDVMLEPFSLRKYLKAGLDLKVWGFAMIYFCLTTTAYAVAFSLPIILLKGMGFSLAEAQCLVAPPYVLACIFIYITGWIGDKYRISAPIFIFHACLTITGLALIGWTKGSGTRYFGVFLTTASANANIPTVMTYQANNIRGQWKRAFCSATFVSFGSMGGIAGSLVFRTQDAPMYHNGVYACIACNLVLMLLVGMLSVKFHLANKRAENGGKIIGGLAGFRYTL